MGKKAYIRNDRLTYVLTQIEGDTGEKITSSELLEQSSRIAAGLQLAGVSAGDLVVLCCDKSIVAYSLLLGAMFTGATVILAPPPRKSTLHNEFSYFSQQRG